MAMNTEDFDKLLSRIKGVDPEALTEEQRAQLSAAIAPGAGSSKLEGGWRYAVSLFLFGLVCATLLGQFPIGNDTTWMLNASIGAVLIWIALFFTWAGTESLRKPVIAGTWMWGGIMMLIALNFGAVVVFASACVEIGAAKLFQTVSESCKAPERQTILRFFLAAKEFGAVLGVALGFASIAWVNFFTKER